MVRGPAASATASIPCRLVSSPKVRGKRSNCRLCLYDLACFNTTGADANALVPARNLSLDRAEINVPAALGHIVRMRNLIAELRTFTANCANLSHHELQYLNFSH